MPKFRQTDPLLGFARVLTVIAKVILVIVLLAIVIVTPFMLSDQAMMEAALQAGGSGAPLWQALAAVLLFMILLAAMIGAVIRFVHLLGRIIDTVGSGDPFIEANARRLTAMGWITLGVMAAAAALEALGFWLNSLFPEGFGGESWHFSVDGDAYFSPETLILAIVLFILARVFRKGAEMRDDLEGTV